MLNKEYRDWILNYLNIGKEVLYLSMDDCKATGVSDDKIIELTEKAMVAYSTGHAEMPAKIGIHPLQTSLMHAMPAYLPDEYACGIKWGCVFPENREKFNGMISTPCHIVYNDPESGLAMAYMDATWITEVRTPAVALVSMKYLANLDTTTFGMFGCGIQGKATVRMVERVLKNLDTIYIYDVYEPAMDALVEMCQPVVKAKIVKCKSPEELVKSSEVIASAVAYADPSKSGISPQPFVEDIWVSKGQTLVCSDAHSTFADATYKRADIYVVDSVAQHKLLAGYGYYPYGQPEIYAEVGAVAAGLKPGRTSKDQLCIAVNVGMAVEDMICAKAVFEGALKNNIGVKLPLWDRTASK